MNASFSIDADPARDLIRIRTAGFFTPDDLARFAEAWRAALARLRCPRNRHLTLVDMRAAGIQTQETVGRWRSMIADPVFRSRRLAVGLSGTLARMQLQRAIAGIGAQAFTDEAEAEAWLLADEAVPVHHADMDLRQRS